jgi:hypothetical protein
MQKKKKKKNNVPEFFASRAKALVIAIAGTNEKQKQKWTSQL